MRDHLIGFGLFNIFSFKSTHLFYMFADMCIFSVCVEGGVPVPVVALSHPIVQCARMFPEEEQTEARMRTKSSLVPCLSGGL